MCGTCIVVCTPVTGRCGVAVSTPVTGTCGVAVCTPVTGTCGVAVCTPVTGTCGVAVCPPVTGTCGVAVCPAADQPWGDPADPNAEPVGTRGVERGVVRQVRAGHAVLTAVTQTSLRTLPIPVTWPAVERPANNNNNVIGIAPVPC